MSLIEVELDAIDKKLKETEEKIEKYETELENESYPECITEGMLMSYYKEVEKKIYLERRRKELEKNIYK